jgi:hypothetical protein
MAYCIYTYSKVTIGAAALGHGLANLVYEVLLAAASSGADSLLLELDLRHDVRSRTAQLAQWVGGVIRFRSR